MCILYNNASQPSTAADIVECSKSAIEAMPQDMPRTLQAAARILLHDWNDGRIPFFTMPPQRDTHGHAAAAVIPSWSQDFNVDEVSALHSPSWVDPRALIAMPNRSLQ